MTERLYHADSYVREFEATCVASEADRIYLDRTAFYPTSGGQQFDTGHFRVKSGQAQSGGSAELVVVDVKDEGERIAHVLGADAPLPAVGSRIVGQIDWARRFDHMQQHTGQHLLSAVFQELLGAATLSVHFGVDASTIDIELPELGLDSIRLVEARANALVFENRAVSASVEAAEQATGLRKASERTGPLRIISIDALDRSACGGTHVARTGEIGPILLGKLDRVRKNVRIEFVCGGRATRRARADYEALSRLSNRLGTAIDSVAEVTEQRLDELERQVASRRKLEERLDEYRARELYAEHRAKQVPASDDTLLTWGIERSGSRSLQELRGLAQQYIRLPRSVLIVAAADPPGLIVAASEDSGVDAGSLLKAGLAQFKGRGGGSPRLAQGSVENSAALESLLDWFGGQLA